MSEPVLEPRSAKGSASAAIYPQTFTRARRSAGAEFYLREPLVQKLAEFFEGKGLAAIKDEDQREQWYEDWIAYQGGHQLYARLLSPKAYSSLGTGFDLLRYTRFLEVCAYFSPSHCYSLQVTFLGLSAILLGNNPDLKREAVRSLEAGGLMAFGVSEKGHGSDLLGNEFTVSEAGADRFVANGSKYYIGNSNCASIISILAGKRDRRGATRRAPMMLFALRPKEAPGFRSVKKIRTLGVRAAHVGEFEVKDHEFPKGDVIAVERQAWEAVFGTVTLGKFFLGFGSIGICERAFEEAAVHLRSRVLYGKPVIEMPHIRATMVQAYARLTAMKLYAYRALDYVRASHANDRRYLLFAAVQKAKLSTEGVKVVALLSDCIGARGFEADTYFEMALRDVQLIPGLEGSRHINLGLTGQFVDRYFGGPDSSMVEPGSLVVGEMADGENSFLMEARTGAINTIGFPDFLRAYLPLLSIGNVRMFVEAAEAFQLFVRNHEMDRTARADTPIAQAMGQCMATIAYGQLIAEHVVRLEVSTALISVIFHGLVTDLGAAALTLVSCNGAHATNADLLRHLVRVPTISNAECDFVSKEIAETESDRRAG